MLISNMNNTLENLKSIGLSEKETDIYLYLLKSGPTLGRHLIVDLNLEKTACYATLNLLKSKRLIYEVGKNRNKKFVAVTPEKLLELVDTKKKELESTEKEINGLLDSLTDYAKTMYTKRNIQIIEGSDGFEKWMAARLEAKSGTFIREISSNKHQESFIKDRKKFKDMSLRFPVERISKKIGMKALMTKNDIEEFNHLYSVEKTDPEMLKEVRLLPDSFKIEAGFQTYNNKVSFMREYQGDFLGIIIEDKFIVSLMNSMFDLIFENAEII